VAERVNNAEQYAIWVDFEIDPTRVNEFMVSLHENARVSLSLEPGCRHFDVLVPSLPRDAVSLYEIYDNEAAFQAHLDSSHYRAFAEAVTPAVLRKEVRVFALQAPKGTS